MERYLSPEGPVFGFLDKAGQLILLSLLWILGCLPLVTVVPATTALYYAVMKSVRRERGRAAGEFFQSFRRNLKRGIPITLLLALPGALMCVNLQALGAGENGGMAGANLLLLILLAMTAVYISPVLSRFDMGIGKALKLSFVMAIRFLPYTLLILASAVLLGYVQFFLLPMPTVLLLPSLVCLGVTFLMEKALRKFMPEKKPGDVAWYYE